MVIQMNITINDPESINLAWRYVLNAFKALKLPIQLQEFRDAIPQTLWEKALEMWIPKDLWICSTNDMGLRVENELLQVHLSRFSNEPSIIRFEPNDSVKHKYGFRGNLCKFREAKIM
jgi:hypothetical protein